MVRRSLREGRGAGGGEGEREGVPECGVLIREGKMEEEVEDIRDGEDVGSHCSLDLLHSKVQRRSPLGRS